MREKKLYLPTWQENTQRREPPLLQTPKGIYPCPCCGFLTLPVPREEAIAYGCPVCYWENDVFIGSDDEPSDENHGMTLKEAQRNFRELGACSARWISYVRVPTPEEIPSGQKERGQAE